LLGPTIKHSCKPYVRADLHKASRQARQVNK
jgi:hypothetical protein